MVIHEMTDEECRACLSGRVVARLACALDNQPYVVPIHLNLAGDYFYGYATLGQKIEWMRRNRLVCLEIESVTTNTQWETIVVFGEFEELPAAAASEEARQVADGLFQATAMWWEPAAVPLADHDPRAPIVFRIRISRMTGRRASAASTRRI